MNTFNKVITNQKNNSDYFYENLKTEQINKLLDLIIKYKDENIYFSGVGKSGNLAIHLADLFKSIGLKSYTLNILNSTHGDIGCIKNNDLIIFLSKSGNTQEIYDTVDIYSCFKILVCCNSKAKISNKVQETYIIPMEEEGDIFFNSVPSNSILNTISYFNIIFNLYIDKVDFKLNDYKKNHPAGDIGFKNKKVKDFINYDTYICNDINISIKEIIELLKVNKSGIVFQKLIDGEYYFYGIVTTKDILNIISNDVTVIEKSITDYINKNPLIIEGSDSLISSKIEQIRKYPQFIPVIDQKKFIGIIDNKKILKFI